MLLIAVYFIPLRTIRANLKSFRGVKYFFTFCHLILHSIWHRGLFRTFIVSSVIGSVLFWGRIFGIWSEIAAFLDQNWLRPILMNFCIFKIVMLILGGGLSYNYVKGTDWRKGEKKEVTSWRVPEINLRFLFCFWPFNAKWWRKMVSAGKINWGGV